MIPSWLPFRRLLSFPCNLGDAWPGVFNDGTPRNKPTIEDGMIESLEYYEKNFLQDPTFVELPGTDEAVIYLEEAQRELQRGLQISHTFSDVRIRTHHETYFALCLGNLTGRRGLYEKASNHLEKALETCLSSSIEAMIRCELANIHRRMGHLDTAWSEAEKAYVMSKSYGLRSAVCGALAHLGSIRFEAYQRTKSRLELDKAIILYNVSDGCAQRYLQNLATEINSSPETLSSISRILNRSRVQALYRLSLCHDELGDLQKSLQIAAAAHDISTALQSPIQTAYASFFYARCLFKAGDSEAARSLMATTSQSLTPAMIFCKETSDDSNLCLQQMVDSDLADFRTRTKEGQSALEMAVVSGNATTIEIVRRGLRNNLDRFLLDKSQIMLVLSQLEAEARIQAAYREVFYEYLRPTLLYNMMRRMSFLEKCDKPASDDEPAELTERRSYELRVLWSLQSMTPVRKEYQTFLQNDPAMLSMFDPLYLISYFDLLRQGELCPSNSNCEARPYEPEEESQYVIFLSYARLRKGKCREDSPDDVNNTVFKRMIAAIEEFLSIHKFIARRWLRIWVDYSCVNPSNRQPGINALPIIVSQCDAVISLVDETYYTRAWCSVEVLMAQTLAKTYGLIEWWEQIARSEEDPVEELPEAYIVGCFLESNGKSLWDRQAWMLEPGDMRKTITVSDKDLSFEEDRARVIFLERQSRLLG